ncbi:hypothetical protein GF322_00590 [Candidatus Dependentiae bacterium]|nr:hypothetical protein [Candidatus Dependentiae bacterium]
MFNFIFGSPAWQLIVQSDWMTKFVLLILFLLSVSCIAIVTFKFMLFKKQKNKMTHLFIRLKGVTTFNELLNVGKDFQECTGGKFLAQNLKELKSILDQQHQNNQKLTSQELEYLELSTNQTIDQLIMENETYLPILGTSAAVSPLIGLFGTVWGLIHSFVNISQEKSADIAVVAPGIAEALTTTLAGLIVAIPAMIAFHYFSNELRKQEQQLDHLADKYLNIIKKTFYKS